MFLCRLAPCLGQRETSQRRWPPERKPSWCQGFDRLLDQYPSTAWTANNRGITTSKNCIHLHQPHWREIQPSTSQLINLWMSPAMSPEKSRVTEQKMPTALPCSQQVGVPSRRGPGGSLPSRPRCRRRATARATPPYTWLYAGRAQGGPEGHGLPAVKGPG